MQKNKDIYSLIFFITIMLTTNFVSGGNLLKNGGFEIKSAKPGKNLFCQDWPITLSSKAKKCRGELSTDAYKGKYSLKLILEGDKKTNDLWTGQKIKAVPGSKLNFKLYAKGSKGRRFYVQFMPQAGRKYLKSTYNFFPFKQKWTKVSGSYTVPKGAEYIHCLIHMLREPAEGYFDEFELSLSQESMLQNKLVSVKLNQITGGCIDSFIELKTGFNYTKKRLPLESGGLCVDILPGNTYPGVFANALYQSEVIVPYRKIKLSRKIDSGKFSGLNLTKTISLPEDNSSKITVNVTLENESSKPLSFVYRVQNVISPASGEFSFPARDWLTVFKRTPQSIKTINTLKLDDLRAGWCAKKYFNRKTIVFNFNNKSVNKLYNYLVKELDTMEWYYKKINLNAGELWKNSYSIELLPSGEKPYSGKIKYKTKPVRIKGVKLAAPKKSQKALPKNMQGYFPYGTTLTSMVIPEAGGARSRGLNYRYAYQRQVRESAANYFNNFYFAHLSAGDVNLADILGKDAQKYDMTMTLNMQCIHRKDVDVKKFNKEFPDRINKKYRLDDLRKTIKKYKNNILCCYTGDELSASNINCMVAGQEMLKKELNTDKAFFPYLILANKYFELAKYLPVYLGDHYPIYGKEELLRNPWSVAGKIREAVKALPNTQVWFMPQGFATRKNVYAMPTQSEIRLMVYAAVSQGAKGVIFFGLNYSSFWLVKAGNEEIYSMNSAEGARLPQWKTIGECGRELTAIGPRLFYTKPEWNYKNAKIACNKISKTSRKTKVYEGPAITVSSLKHKNKNLRYLLVVNQDDNTRQTGILSFHGAAKKSGCYDLTRMKYIKTAGNLKITLEPGDARFFILGSGADIKPEIEQIFTNRYQREKVRYIIASERAGKNGVKVPSVPEGSGESAYKAIIAAQHKLQKALQKTEFGKSLKQWQNARTLLGKIDRVVRNNIDSIIPSVVRDKAKNFRKLPKPTDPALRALMERIESDFFNYWKLDRAIENGKYKENKKQIEELIRNISIDAQKISTYVKNKR